MPVADTAARPSALPPVPTVQGPLAIRVVYPAPDAVVRARDSSFLFGSAGTGEAKLTINGHPVRVWPNGAWLAWIPLPHDSVMQFRIVAHTATDTGHARLPRAPGQLGAGARGGALDRHHLAHPAGRSPGGRPTST